MDPESHAIPRAGGWVARGAGIIGLGVRDLVTYGGRVRGCLVGASSPLFTEPSGGINEEPVDTTRRPLRDRAAFDRSDLSEPTPRTASAVGLPLRQADRAGYGPS